MLKPHFLALISCLGLSGCAGFTTSQTWEKVVRTRPDSYSDVSDDSGAYAAKLHRVLKAASVEHKVVTYEYHYTTSLREEAVGTHTAVLYRDDSDPSNPWWLMEDRLDRPVWLAGENLESQMSFYVRHKVDVVNEKSFPASGQDQKATVAIARSANGYEHAGSGSPHRVHFRSAPSSNYYEMAAVLPQSAAHRNAYAALFHSVHGTVYNPSSAVDRRKMAALQNDASRHRRPLAAQTL